MREWISASRSLTEQGFDDVVNDDLTRAEKILLKTVGEHAKATSPTGKFEDGHNNFSLEDSPDGSYIKCHHPGCGKWLPLS